MSTPSDDAHFNAVRLVLSALDALGYQDRPSWRRSSTAGAVLDLIYDHMEHREPGSGGAHPGETDDAEAENACGCDCQPLDETTDEAAFFAEIDKRLAELATIAHRALDAGPNGSYWISDDGVIHDVEVHSGVVSFELARLIADHNREMRAAK